MASKQNAPTEQGTVCPNCQMPQKDWPGSGYRVGSQTYCCQGCAEQTGCTCDQQKRTSA